MHNTVKRAFLLLIVVGMFLAGVTVLIISFVFNGEKWATHRSNQHLYTAGQIISAGTIYDDDGKILAQTVDGKRKFNTDSTVRKATLHAIGDTEGYMSTGVHALFEPELTGYNLIFGTYYLEKNRSGNEINLTLKSDVCAEAYKALGDRKGTVGVYNYKTGEIVCMVSTPSYDPENKPDKTVMDSDAYKGAYINKFLSSTFTPGSTFKTVTAACAIENISDIESRTFTCNKIYKIGNSKVVCNSNHGKLTFEQALNRSCNVAFAQLAVELGKDKLQKTANELGLTSSFELDKVNIAKGKIDLSKAVDIDMGWAGIGQYTVEVNPCMMMTLFGAIANGGKAVQPYYLKSIVSSEGFTTNKGKTKTYTEINLSPSTANKLADLLRSNVKNYYGDWSFPGLEMCGKTGTAEVGDSKTGDNALFCGFSKNENFPYAVIVVLEDVHSSARTLAIPVANRVLQKLKSVL